MTPAAPPDGREFWAWVWSAVRPFVGWVLFALGALALFLGWYGVSGEALTAKQLPYLVSGGLTGIALVILAGVFLATDDVRRQLRHVTDLERKVDELYRLLVTAAETPVPAAPAGPPVPAAALAGPPAAPATAPPPAGAVLALPAGTSYHRPECALVAGKSDAAPVDAADVARRSLKPCRVCEPGPLG